MIARALAPSGMSNVITSCVSLRVRRVGLGWMVREVSVLSVRRRWVV